jgi:hypothetical protein
MPNDRLNLGIDFRPAETLLSGSKAPEQTKARPTPGDYGFRLNNLIRALVHSGENRRNKIQNIDPAFAVEGENVFA